MNRWSSMGLARPARRRRRVEPTWTRIINGQSGARKIETFDVSDLTSRIARTILRAATGPMALSMPTIGWS